MRAADGAIEVVRIANDALELEVIGGDIEPVGLCGSGLVDAVAELVRAGLLEPSGRFVSEEQAASLSPGLARRLVARPDGERIFVLHWAGEEGDADAAVYLSQRDVRELQFGKAAIATGWKLLVEELGIDERDIQQVLLAGSFGSYLSPASAIRIGLVPKLPRTRIISAGNVAGEGAKMALLSLQERHAAQAMVERDRLRRALGSPGLQRPLRRPARLPGMTVPRERILVLACGALAREVLALARLNGWAHVDVRCLPARLHLVPDEIPAARSTRSWRGARSIRPGVRRLRRLRNERRASTRSSRPTGPSDFRACTATASSPAMPPGRRCRTRSRARST